MNKKDLIEKITSYQGNHVFNPYTDICPVHDKKNAPEIRLTNLTRVLDSAINQGTDSIWIGRDLGYKGGRRTGLALTDEANLYNASKKWGISLNQATQGDAYAERTAKNIWNFLRVIEQNIFMWNVFPFHPHEINLSLIHI